MNDDFFRLDMLEELNLEQNRNAYWNNTKEQIARTKNLEKGVFEIEHYVKNKKILMLNFLLNIIVAFITVFVFKFNIVAFAISFIIFDMICIILDKILFSRIIKKTYFNYTKEEMIKIVELFKDMWSCEKEKDGIAYYWLKEIEKIRDNTIEEEKIKEKMNKYVNKNVEKNISYETSCLSDKDNERFLDLFNKFNNMFNSFDNKKEKKIFSPCLNACNLFKERQVGENKLLYSTNFVKQFLNFLEEFVDNMVVWGTLSDIQKKEYKDGMFRATTAFEKWTCSSIDAIEKNTVSGLRVSINTLTEMLEENINNQ